MTLCIRFAFIHMGPEKSEVFAFMISFMRLIVVGHGMLISCYPMSLLVSVLIGSITLSTIVLIYSIMHVASIDLS